MSRNLPFIIQIEMIYVNSFTCSCCITKYHRGHRGVYGTRLHIQFLQSNFGNISAAFIELQWAEPKLFYPGWRRFSMLADSTWHRGANRRALPCTLCDSPESRYPALLLESSLTPHSEEKTGVYTYWMSLALSKPLNICTHRDKRSSELIHLSMKCSIVKCFLPE